MRRAASRACQPAQLFSAARASVRRVFRGCLAVFIDVCTYINCTYMESPSMTATGVRYGLATPAEAAGKTGRELLQAMIDGLLPAPPICETLSFRLVEVGDGFAAF